MLDDLRSSLGIKPNDPRPMYEIVSHSFITGNSTPPLRRTTLGETLLEKALQADTSVGATSRSLWMLVAWEILDSEGLTLLSFGGDEGSPPMMMLLSKERLGFQSWRLQTLSKTAVTLAVHFDWELAQATTFLLKGQPPFTKAINVSVLNTGGFPGPRFEMRSDVSVSPAELSKAYIEARTPHARGYKGMGKKHTALATFASRYSLESPQQWQQAMRDWNSWTSEHMATDDRAKYDNVALFKRDVQKAKDRLLRRR